MITAANFEIIKTIKDRRVFLVGQGNHRAILKSEYLDAPGSSQTKFGEIDDKKNLGQKKLGVIKDGDTKREKWVKEMDNQKPQVRETILISSKLVSHITKNATALGETQVFSDWDSRTISHKVGELERTNNSLQNKKIVIEIQSNYVWILIPLLKNFGDLGTVPSKQSNWYDIPEKVRNAIKTNPKCMRSLGHVLIIDAFLANTDRFGRLGATEQTPKASLGVANSGNVFVSWDKDEHNPHFLALDPFDTQQKNIYCYFGITWDVLSKKIETDNRLSSKDIIFNFYLLMRGYTKNRNVAAEWALEQFFSEINRIEKSNNPIPDKDSAFLKELRAGMHEGRERLQEFYKKKLFYKEWPTGLASRFNVLF